MALFRRSLLALSLCLAACGGGDDDGDPAIDAPMQACVLPAAVTACTIGDNAPCTALCAAAYCHNYNQLPSPVCTSNCTVGSTTECPTGWTCNTMGRCRPPD